MDILPLGLSSFKLRGKHASLVTDPYDSEAVGIKFPKNIDADIVTISHDHDDHNNSSAVLGSPYIVSGPGEYEIKGISIIGIGSYHDSQDGKERGRNTIYRIEIDGIHIAHLGDLGHTLSAAQIEALDGVDILCVPTGGVYSLDPAKAIEVIASIEPKIVIPMHYGTQGLNPKIFEKLEPLSTFLKQIGKEVVPTAKLSVTKDKLLPEMQVVVLE